MMMFDANTTMQATYETIKAKAHNTTRKTNR